jgi:hypothetical protein
MMHERNEGPTGSQADMSKKRDWITKKMIWKQLDDDVKTQYLPRALVKGYMRPDGTSYYVAIPKKIRELFKLNGGEYFITKAKPEKGAILLKLVEFADEEPNVEPETK